MRTTITLDPDVVLSVKSRMATQKATLKQVINDALRRGLSVGPQKPSQPFLVTPHSFGFRPGIDIHQLNKLADDLEAQAFTGKTARRKKRR